MDLTIYVMMDNGTHASCPYSWGSWKRLVDAMQNRPVGPNMGVVVMGESGNANQVLVVLSKVVSAAVEEG